MEIQKDRKTNFKVEDTYTVDELNSRRIIVFFELWFIGIVSSSILFGIENYFCKIILMQNFLFIKISYFMALIQRLSLRDL